MWMMTFFFFAFCTLHSYWKESKKGKM
jgi:hypothetical protein